MGIPFALLMTLMDVFLGEEFSVFKFIFHTVFFGGTMAMFAMYMQKGRLKKMGVTDFTTENLAVNQSRVIQSNISIKELIDRLKSDEFFGKMKLKENRNVIQLRSKASWRSWGEKIRIIIISEESGLIKYDVFSEPVIGITLVDYGKNLENVERLERLMTVENL